MRLSHVKNLIFVLSLLALLVGAGQLFSNPQSLGVPVCGYGWYYGCGISLSEENCYTYCSTMCDNKPVGCDVQCCRNPGSEATCIYYCW